MKREILTRPHKPSASTSVIRSSDLVPPAPPVKTKPRATRFFLEAGPDNKGYSFSYEGPWVDGAVDRLQAIAGARIIRARITGGGKRLALLVALAAPHDYGAFQSFFSIGKMLSEAGDVVDLHGESARAIPA